MGQRILIWRYGAFGDMIFTVPLINRLKKEGHTLFLHTGAKGKEIFLHDPRFEAMTFYEPFFSRNGDITQEQQDKQNEDLQAVIDEDMSLYKPDLVLNLSHTVETSMIPVRGEEAFDWPIEKRRDELSPPTMSFWEKCLEAAAEILPYKRLELGGNGVLAYTPLEIHAAESARKRFFDGKFLVILSVSGTTHQKRFPQAAAIAEKIVDRYPDAVVLVQSDRETLLSRRGEFTRVNHKGRIFVPDPNGPHSSFRKSLLLTRYADIVIGPETGLICGAGIWGTPKIMLCTTSTVYSCVAGTRNDLSMQAEIACSPCLRAIYSPDDCYLGVDEKGCTPCNYEFKEGEILERVDLVYRKMRYMRGSNGSDRTEPLQVSELRPLIIESADPRGPVRKGVHREIPGVPGNPSREADQPSPLGNGQAVG